MRAGEIVTVYAIRHLGIGNWHTGTGMTDCHATNLGHADPPTQSPEEGDAIYSLVICSPAVLQYQSCAAPVPLLRSACNQSCQSTKIRSLGVTTKLGHRICSLREVML